MFNVLKNKLNRVSSTQRNIYLFTLEGAVGAVILNLANPFFSMFAKRMGAGDYQIGLVNSLPALIGIVALVPGALMVDRQGSKKRIVSLLILLTGILYPIAALTPFLGSWSIPLYIILLALINWPFSVFNISWQSFFSDVFRDDDRNIAYALRSRLANILAVVTALGSGLVLSYIPHSDGQRIIIYQIFFAVTLGLAALQGWLLSRVSYSPVSLKMSSTPPLKSFLNCMKSLPEDKPFLSFILTAFLFHITWQMAWPLFFLYQVDYLHANEAWLSYISVASNLAGAATYLGWSKLVERKGAKFVIIIGALGLSINPAIAVVCKTLPQLLVINIITGLTFSSFQLALFDCLLEVVPEQNKTLYIAIYTTLISISGFIAPIIGVSIYKLTSIYFSMDFAAALRLGATGLFVLRYWKDRRKNYRNTVHADPDV